MSWQLERKISMPMFLLATRSVTSLCITWVCILILWLENSEFLNDTHRENCVLLDLVQERLLLTFFIWLPSQLSSVHSIITYYRKQMLEKGDSSNRQQKWMVAPFIRFFSKFWVGFCLNTGKRCLLDVSFHG